jgi:hypothetical protein
MKRFAFILLWFLPFYGFSNPIYIQDIRISELIFDTDSTWKIEIWCVDSIMEQDVILKSSTDSVKIHLGTYSTNFVLISSKDHPLKINHSGDQIVMYYALDPVTFSYYYSDKIIFGNYANAFLPSPGPGQSIVNDNNYRVNLSNFCFTDSITPGKANYVKYAKMKGKIYRADGKTITPPSDRYYYIDARKRQFLIMNDGFYSIDILLKKYAFDYITFYNIDSLYDEIDFIEKINFDALTPDTTINVDIHIKTQVISNKNYFIGESSVSVFPNPGKSDDAVIKYSLPESVHEAELVISDMSGRVLYMQKLVSQSDVVTLKSAPELMPGVYIVNITWQNTVLSSTRMMILSR